VERQRQIADELESLPAEQAQLDAGARLALPVDQPPAHGHGGTAGAGLVRGGERGAGTAGAGLSLGPDRRGDRRCRGRRDAGRRAEFLEAIATPVLLFAGGWMARNYPANWWPFRADSTFLFLFPEPEPDAAALFDPKDGSVTLFLGERTPEDALWHGPVPGFRDLEKGLGVTAIEKRTDLAAVVKR